jgi:hypothetical protein
LIKRRKRAIKMTKKPDSRLLFDDSRSTLYGDEQGVIKQFVTFCADCLKDYYHRQNERVAEILYKAHVGQELIEQDCYIALTMFGRANYIRHEDKNVRKLTKFLNKPIGRSHMMLVNESPSITIYRIKPQLKADLEKLAAEIYEGD